MQRTRQTRQTRRMRRMRRMMHRMLRRAARGGGARRRWRVGRAARRRCCRRGFTRRRRRSLSRRRSARGDRRRRCRARARRRVRRRAESAALVAPQLAAAAAWDARLWAWAAPRTPEERLRCSDPSCDIWRRHRPVPKPAHVRLPTPHRCHATCAARPARAAAGRAAQPTRRHDICTLGGRPAIRDTSRCTCTCTCTYTCTHSYVRVPPRWTVTFGSMTWPPSRPLPSLCSRASSDCPHRGMARLPGIAARCPC